MAATGRLFNGPFISNTAGEPIGVLGLDGREYLLPVLPFNATPATAQPTAFNGASVAITGGTINGTSVGATTPSTGAFTTLSATGAVTLTSGTINGTSVGLTTRSGGYFSYFATSWNTSVSTPGNATVNSVHGRSAFAAAASTVTITSSVVADANASVFVQLMGSDATLTSVRVTSVSAGSFVVTGNAAATAITQFSWFVVNT